MGVDLKVSYFITTNDVAIPRIAVASLRPLGKADFLSRTSSVLLPLSEVDPF